MLTRITAAICSDHVRSGDASFGLPRAGIRREPGSFEAVEDEVEAEFVFVAVAVAGLKDVLDGQLGEARVFLGGELEQEGLASSEVSRGCRTPDSVPAARSRRCSCRGLRTRGRPAGS